MFVILAPSREVLKAVAVQKAQKLRARAKEKNARRAAASENTGEVPVVEDPDGLEDTEAVDDLDLVDDELEEE